MPKKIFLVDGMSLVFRAYHALSASRLTTKTGEPSWAVFAFTNMLTSILDREQPEYIAVIFDTQKPTFRHEQFAEYKANRKAFPEDLSPQLLRIKEMLDALGIPRFEVPGFEADDVIGTLCKIATKEKKDVLCVTSDKDYYQLVNEHIAVYRPTKDTGSYEIITAEMVPEKFGVPPHQVIDLLSIIGDASDNVPGVKGIGEKTAIPLVQEFGTLENIYENIDRIQKESVRKKLVESREAAFMSKQLVTIHCDMPLEFGTEDCCRRDVDMEKLTELANYLGFRQLKRRFNIPEDGETPASEKPATQENTSAADDDISFEAPPVLQTIADIEHEYILVDTEESFRSMLKEIEGEKVLSFDLETDGLDNMRCGIVGIALSVKPGRAFYVAVSDDYSLDLMEKKSVKKAAAKDASQDSLFGEEPKVVAEEGSSSQKYSPGPDQKLLPIDYAIKHLKPLLEDKKTGKCGQNLKFDALIMKRYGVEVSPVEFDSMLASYILNPDDQHGMDPLSEKWLHYTPISIKTLIGEKKKDQISMRDVDPAKVAEYAGEDADVALKLRNVLREKLVEQGLLPLAEEIEFPLVEVLVQMECNGVAIDTAALKDISDHVTVETAQLRDRIYEEAGQEFLIDSPKQLGEILFGKMKIPSLKNTKTGYSTDVGVLTELAETYPICGMVLEYRQLQKLKSTYTDALPKMIHPKTGRVHTTFNQTIASTGRLSSTDPNLQNIPIRTELGRSIRKAFVAQEEDAVIFSADYSQIELRIMAHVSGDDTLRNAFQNNLDIHAATAATLFGVDVGKVDGNMRRVAKTVNFGVMYGIGAFGLAQRLGMSRKEGQDIIKNYFDKYPKIKAYMDATIRQAEEQGYVETLRGRRRYFPMMKSFSRQFRQAAERAAINAPIQGTAADMMKVAMINIHREMKKRKLESLMTLQVHDELVFEAINGELEELRDLVKREMEAAMPMGDVPILVETGVGHSWYEAH